MLYRNYMMMGLAACLSLTVACDLDKDDDEPLATDGSGDGDGDGDGDDQGQTTGQTEPDDGEDTGESDDDGEPSTGDGDGDLEEEDFYCLETYSGDCKCTDPGEPCMQACKVPDGELTCADVCATIGESCAETCGVGVTYVTGPGPDECPVVGEFGTTYTLGCNEPVPLQFNPNNVDPLSVACCCTRD
jgi:hypothetical protein